KARVPPSSRANSPSRASDPAPNTARFNEVNSNGCGTAVGRPGRGAPVEVGETVAFMRLIPRQPRRRDGARSRALDDWAVREGAGGAFRRRGEALLAGGRGPGALPGIDGCRQDPRAPPFPAQTFGTPELFSVLDSPRSSRHRSLLLEGSGPEKEIDNT